MKNRADRKIIVEVQRLSRLGDEKERSGTISDDGCFCTIYLTTLGWDSVNRMVVERAMANVDGAGVRRFE